MDPVRDGLEAALRVAFGDPTLVIGEIIPIPSGHSGLTSFVDAIVLGRPRRFVLRLPPAGARTVGPADVVRQGRIMRALHAAGQPVPPVPIISEDAATLGGRPFILMDAVAGAPFTDAVREHGADAVARTTVEALRRLHETPLERTGLSGETAMSLHGEVKRWTELMARGVTELTAAAPELERRLAGGTPAEHAPGLVHGDYHYGNLLFDGLRVAAILDWEIAQVGQPLLDLATLCVVSERRRFPADPNTNAIDVSSERLLELYAADAGEMRWYVALGCYKYAAIFAYNLGLHRRGKRIDPHYERLTATIPGLLRRGLEILG